MSLVIEVNGTAIVDAVQPSSVGAQMRADDGDVGFGGFLVDDPGAAITTTGHHVVTVEESACSQARLFTGYLTERDIARSLDRGMLAGDDPRAHEATAVDVNAVFSFRVIRGSGAKRPAETMEDRLTWLLGSTFLSPFIEDTGFVSYYPLNMDEADYTGATPAAVLDDLVERKSDTTLTYFAFWDPVAAAVGLYFGGEGTGIGESTLSISNVIADINNTTVFAPDAEAKLSRTPEEVYSEVVLEYASGTKRIYRRREATYTAFGIDRGTTIQRPYTQSATTAQRQADRWLTKHGSETDEITVAIIVPPASAGLALAGQRIDVKFSHLPGYTTWTSMRIVTSTVTPLNDTANNYRVELVLRMPVAGSAPSADCDGTYASNSLAGIVPTYAQTAGLTDVPTDLAYASDGDMEAYAYWDDELAGVGTWVRDFIFTLPTPMSLSAITLSAQWYGLGIGTSAEALSHFSIVLDGTTYDDSYATMFDRDIWTYMDEPGNQTFHYSKIATWRFDTQDDVDTITVRVTDVHDSLQVTKPIRLSEVAACVFDADEQEDLAQTPTSPVITTTDPTVNDDANDGYTVGQTWVNTTTGDVFVLTDSTVGAAVWTEVSGAGVSDHGALTGLTDDDHTQYVLKRYGGKEVVSTVAAAGATETLDLANGNVFDVTLDADCTLTFAGATNGVACSFTLVLRQDGTGGRTTTWPGSVVWAGGTAPTLDETASTAAVLTFFTLDGGTTWYGFPTGGGGGGEPATAVESETTWGIAPAVGTDTEYARQDHTHGTPAEPAPGGVGPLLIEDTPAGSPLVFADLLQNEEGTDLLYADAV